MFCCPCLTSKQMNVDFTFDEHIQPLTIELQLNDCSVMSEDVVYLVPGRLSQNEVLDNDTNLTALNLLPDPVFKNKARATLDKKILGNYYLIYARYNRIAEFIVLGTSRRFHFKPNVIRRSIGDSEKTLEEWTKSLLRSTRIEDENEQEIVIKLFENSREKSSSPEKLSEAEEHHPKNHFTKVLRDMINIHNKKKHPIKQIHRVKGNGVMK